MEVGDKLAAHEGQASRPTNAQTARTLVSVQTYGTLCTLSASPATQGYPNGAVAPYATDEQGRPIIALSDLSGHKRDLQANGRASLMITQGGFQSMNDARCTLTGSFSELAAGEASRAARDVYMERHPDAFWVDFGDFSFLRMDELVQVNFIGGFGRISQIKADDYWAAAPDPVAQFSKPVCDHMNADHSETLVAIVKHQVGIDIEGGKLKAIDRLGFDTECLVNGNNVDIRLNYPEPAEDRKSVKDRIVQMTKAASSSSS